MTGIPDVPPTPEPMRGFLTAVKVALMRLTGSVESLEEAAAQEDDVLASVDDNPPAAPINLAATSANGAVTLVWDSPSDADVVAVEIWRNVEDVQPDPNTQPDMLIATVLTDPDQHATYTDSALTATTEYFYWVRAKDAAGNVSDFNDTAGVAITVAAGDGSGGPPSAPTLVVATGQFKSIWLSWLSPSAVDLSFVSIYEATTSGGTYALVGTQKCAPNAATAWVRAGLGNNLTRYYKLKAVDVDGNESGFTAEVNATTLSVDPADLGTVVGFAAPTGVSITSNAALDADGMQVVNMRTTWTAIVDSRLSFYEVGIVEAGGSEVVFTTNQNNLILYNIRGNTNYDVRVRGVDRNGNRTAFSSSLSHTTANKTVGPAEAINARATLIDPGKIKVSGASSLSSWLYGGDNTLIEGGKIGANSIAVNSIQIGARGLNIAGLAFQWNTPSTNQTTWSSGTISYVSDAGAASTQAISAGSATWTSGILYIYWVKGASTLSATTNAATAFGANNVVMATYAGGSALNATYGRTIIDGDGIKTNSINTNHLQANAVTAGKISVTSLSAITANIGTCNAGVVQNAGGTTFFDLNNSRQQFQVGGYVSRKGNLGSNLLEWFGSNATPIGSETIANSLWAISAADGKVYYGGTELGGGGTTGMTLGISAGLVTTSGSTTSSITATATGGAAPYSYVWTQIFDTAFDTSGGAAYIRANSPTSASSSFTLHGTNPAVSGEFVHSGFLITAFDSDGKSAARSVAARFNA